MPQTALRSPAAPDHDVEALIREARQLRRRRWATRSALLALACGIAGLLIATLITGRTGLDRSAGFVAGAPPVGAPTSLHLASALAVSRSGELYVADAPDGQPVSARADADRVLVRLANGRFRQVAANLPYISDLAVASDGTLYVADAGWVREIGRNGKVHTIAGDGQSPRYSRRKGPLPVPAGTRALAAPLGSIRSIDLTYRSGPLQIAIGPHGQLYIANGDQVLRLTGRGTLQPVAATMTPAAGLPHGQLNATAQIAITHDGTIYTSSLMRGWSLWAINRAGNARYVTYARQSGGNTVDVQSGPHGTVYATNGDSILLIDHGTAHPVFTFNHKIAREYFELTDFAIAPNGVIYADEIPGGGGFEAHQQLVAVHNRHVTLLWQEKNRAPR